MVRLSSQKTTFAYGLFSEGGVLDSLQKVEHYQFFITKRRYILTLGKSFLGACGPEPRLLEALAFGSLAALRPARAALRAAVPTLL